MNLDTARPRVLLVSPVGEHWGAEHVLLSLARHLPEVGVDPVLALMRPGALADLGAARDLQVHVFRDHRYRQLHLVARGIGWLRELIRRERIDLVHSNLTAHLYGAPAARLTGKPELWHIHGYPHRTSLLEKVILRIPTDFALFTTEKVASGFPRLRTGPHAVVYPAPVVAVPAEAERLAGDVRKLYGLPNGPLLLTVARLEELKGHRYLIEAVPKVLQQVPDATFVVAGKPADDQSHYLSELRGMSVQLGVSKSVHFLGHLSVPELQAFYGEAAALVHPALSEAFGLAIVEAMSFGVPVIAAAADGPSELIRSGENGLLVPPSDASALAEAIVRVLDSPKLAEVLAGGGQGLARSLSPEQMAVQTAGVYSTMVSGRQTGFRSALRDDLPA